MITIKFDPKNRVIDEAFGLSDERSTELNNLFSKKAESFESVGFIDTQELFAYLFEICQTNEEVALFCYKIGMYIECIQNKAKTFKEFEEFLNKNN